MQTVKLILSHHIDLALDEAQRIEMAHHVKHQSAPLIGRSILHVHTRHTLLVCYLAYGLPSTHKSLLCSSFYLQRVGYDMQAISLWR